MEPSAGGTPPARPREAVRRLRTALRQALPMLLGVAAFLVAAVPALYDFGVQLLGREILQSEMLQTMNEAVVDVPGVGEFPVLWLALLGWYCILRVVGAMLLLPLAEGRRGLDFRFVSRHLPTALLAAALLLGLHAPYVLAFTSIVGTGFPPVGVSLLFKYLWLVTSLAPAGLAWFVFGRIEREAGGEPPGLLALAGPGLLIGLVTSVVPHYVVREWLSPDLDALQWGQVPFVVGQTILQMLVVVLGQLWFLRYLVLGRPQERPPAPAT